MQAGKFYAYPIRCVDSYYFNIQLPQFYSRTVCPCVRVCVYVCVRDLIDTDQGIKNLLVTLITKSKRTT